MEKIKIKSLSIVFPFFNEEKRIKKSLDKISRMLTKLGIEKTEIILVNDGSNDQSDLIIKKFIKDLNFQKRKKINYIKYLKNMGKGYACKKGVSVARNRWVLTCDIDFSANPTEILNWSKKNLIKSNNECYFGSRNIDGSKIKYRIYRRFLGKIFSKFRNYLFNINILDTQCGFKLYPKKIAKKIFPKISQFGYIHDVEICVILQKSNIKIRELPITWRHTTNSKLNILTDGSKMIFDLIKLKSKI